MRKITMTLAAAIFVVGSMAVANAQTQGASSLDAQEQRAAACGPLAPAGPSSGLRPISLLVRSLLVSRAQIGEFADEAACRRPRFFVPSLRADGSGPKRPARW
jgi:hypothetical protein